MPATQDPQKSAAVGGQHERSLQLIPVYTLLACFHAANSVRSAVQLSRAVAIPAASHHLIAAGLQEPQQAACALQWGAICVGC